MSLSTICTYALSNIKLSNYEFVLGVPGALVQKFKTKGNALAFLESTQQEGMGKKTQSAPTPTPPVSSEDKSVNRNPSDSWWDKPLIDYEKYDEEGAAMEVVFTATQVRCSKVTHNRTQAVQLAGSESLAPWQINTMTKHLLQKLHSSYQSEVDKESMMVMTGYSKGEGYFNEMSLIQLPRTLDYYILCLLPKYPDWLAQQDAGNGDKSQCCETFLLQVIPYLVEVLVQCGVFLV
jgi:hypothetical protein